MARYRVLWSGVAPGHYKGDVVEGEDFGDHLATHLKRESIIAVADDEPLVSVTDNQDLLAEQQRQSQAIIDAQVEAQKVQAAAQAKAESDAKAAAEAAAKAGGK